jgi:YD repeat-containing protein
MVILQLDEPGLLVFENADDVAREIEAIDIEGSLRLAYDENGRRMEIEWIEPNRRSGIGSVTNGKYRLVLSDAVEPEVLARALEQAPYFDPPHLEPKLRLLAQRLRAKV